MENLDVARELEDAGRSPRDPGREPFRIRAYRNAVNTVNSSPRRSLRPWSRRERTSRSSRGSARTSRRTSRSSSRRGASTGWRSSRPRFPRSLVELMRLEGRRAQEGEEALRRARRHHDRRAREGDRVRRGREARGLRQEERGEDPRAIERHRKHTGRFRLDEVEKLIAGLLEHMEGAPGRGAAGGAGSFRRRKETIGDVDLLAAARRPTARRSSSTSSRTRAPRAWRPGPTKGSIVLHSGLQVDLRVMPRSRSARRSSTSPARRSTT
jgi:DNA polymerase (family X)